MSMQVKNDKNASFSGSGISFSMIFNGGGNLDATFRIDGSTISLGGYNGGWNYTGVTGIVDNGASWQSVVLSVNGSGGANAGIMSIYVGGNLFATSNTSFTGRINGGLTKFAIGGKLEGDYQETRTNASDLAFWDTALSAEDASFLKDRASDKLGVVLPEPATASLGLLGGLLLAWRRRRA